MKKIILVILLISPELAFSQITWGTKAGANVTTLGDFNSGLNPLLRLHAGFYYKQRLEEQYGLSIEIQYSMQGASSATINQQYLAYNYLNLPLLLTFYFSDNVFVEIGPQFGYLLYAVTHNGDIKQSITDSLKRFDLAALIGVGKETSFGNYGARAIYGLTNTSGAPVGTDFVFRNLLLQLYVGVTLGQLN